MTNAEIGRLLAENWAEWLRRDSHRLGYPPKTTIARLMESTGIWDDTEERADRAEGQCPVNEPQAALVDRIIPGLPGHHRDLLLAFYAHLDPSRYHQRLQLEKPRVFSDRLHAALVALAIACRASTPARPSMTAVDPD